MLALKKFRPPKKEFTGERQMNIGTSPISFNGSYTATKDGNNAGDTLTFKNDLDVLKKTRERILNDPITNYSTTTDEDVFCINCNVGDNLTISTRAFKTNKSDVSITVKDKEGVNHNLFTSPTNISNATQEELTKALNDFAETLKEKVTEKIQEAQKAIDDFVIGLLSPKQDPPPVDDN